MALEIPAAARLLLLRHGAFERAQEADGRRVERLRPAGRAQADALAEALAAHTAPCVLYSSPAPRAALTAERLSLRLRQPVFADPDLAELRLGRDPDLDAEATAVIWARARAQPGVPALPGAETASALAVRGLAALEGAVRANPDRLVVLFSHGGLVEAVLRTLRSEVGPIGIEHGSGAWLNADPVQWIADFSISPVEGRL